MAGGGRALDVALSHTVVTLLGLFQATMAEVLVVDLVCRLLQVLKVCSEGGGGEGGRLSVCVCVIPVPLT